MSQELWRFDTARFSIRLTAEIDTDADLSWRDEEQATYDDERGVEYYVFTVAAYLDGRKLAWDSLGGSGYSDVREFFTEHRSPDPMNRNCSIMRAARGDNVSICHYFPDMVTNVAAEARAALATMPKVRANT